MTLIDYSPPANLESPARGAMTTSIIRRTLPMALIAISMATEATSALNVRLLRRNFIFDRNLLVANDNEDVGGYIASNCLLFILRGGAQTSNDSKQQDNNDGDSEERQQLVQQKRQQREEISKLLKYRTEQQLLYQLRSTYILEMLALRGVPLPTIVGVATAEGDKPPENVDWDCALSTVEDPKVRLYCYHVICIDCN